MEYSSGQMAEYILDGGKTASNMEKAYTLIQKVFDVRVCGKMVIENIGSRNLNDVL